MTLRAHVPCPDCHEWFGAHAAGCPSDTDAAERDAPPSDADVLAEAQAIVRGETMMLATNAHLRVVLDINEQLQEHMKTMCEESVQAETEITQLRRRAGEAQREREQFHAELCAALGQVAQLVSHSTATLTHPSYEAPRDAANVH